jgi:hypothetical protein
LGVCTVFVARAFSGIEGIQRPEEVI